MQRRATSRTKVDEKYTKYRREGERRVRNGEGVEREGEKERNVQAEYAIASDAGFQTSS